MATTGIFGELFFSIILSLISVLFGGVFGI
jgi:hypothetical protein